MKAERQKRIAQILRRRTVSSQAELLRLLRSRGERVTQATLSRDLEELGAVKARMADGTAAYRLSDEPPNGEDRLRRMLVEFVHEIASSGNIVVIKTPPGCAQPVARAVDATAVEGVLGTVAGDDTILLVAAEGVSGRTLARRIRGLAGQFKELREA